MAFISAKEGPPNAGEKSYTVQYFLALEGRLHATIVHLKNGTMYLRPEYGSHAFTRVT